MRLRKKPWVGQALTAYQDFVLRDADEGFKGKWREFFGRKAPLHVELGTGKGRFVSGMAACNPQIDFIGIEAQQDVLYYAAQKVKEQELKNIRLLVFNVEQLTAIFAPGEIDRLYINFCDPWPKARHAKRRLTHGGFLEKYRTVLAPGGEIYFKTDNRPLFEFTLEQLAQNNISATEVVFDLHAEEPPDNIRTEYEAKFSTLGSKICRCIIKFT
jgi:tRNA (guanine-N7-)-methyltransferase